MIRSPSKNIVTRIGWQPFRGDRGNVLPSGVAISSCRKCLQHNNFSFRFLSTTRTSFSSDEIPLGASSTRNSNRIRSFSIHASQAPLPALAEETIWECEEGPLDSHPVVVENSLLRTGGKNHTGRNNNNNNSHVGGPRTPIITTTPASSNPYPLPETSMSRKTGGGGGGGGRHRCPKCGTFVTFRHTDFDENTFYCAACSGWFVVSPNTMSPHGAEVSPEAAHESVDAYEELLEKTARMKHSEDPTILMQHIPTSASATSPPLASDRRGTTTTEERITIDTEEVDGPIPTTRSDPNPASGGSGSNMARKMPTPREIMRGLNEYVIGQRQVKVALAVGVYNHYKRISIVESQLALEEKKAESAAAAPGQGGSFIPVSGPSIADMNLSQFGSTTVTEELASEKKPVHDINSIADPEFGRDIEDCELDKSNIMLLGPTGSGKTLLVKTLARLIDVPLVIADATCLTQAGYVGEDVESIVLKLYLESGQDIERCQKGIVYIDETDKIRKSGGNVSISRDVSGEGVQHALLKIVEGNVINVPKEPGRKHPRNDFLQIDTSNILFICGGAYSGLERIINRRMDAASIGFGAKMKRATDDPSIQGQYFENVIPKDLVEYGMVPEFVGRFPIIVSTKGLDVENLVDILTTPRNSIMKQYRRLFGMDDVNFHITDDGLEAIAKMAFSRGTGARGLRSITDAVLMETQYVVPSKPDVHTVYLDAAAVRGERAPILLKGDMTVEKMEALMKGGSQPEQEVVDGAVVVNIDEDPEVEEAA